jgi:hypothetical protein
VDEYALEEAHHRRPNDEVEADVAGYEVDIFRAGLFGMLNFLLSDE